MSYVFNPFTGNFDQTSSTSPGGTDTQVQFNDGGSFGGASGLTWNKTTGLLTVNGATLALSGNISAASWGLNGLKLKGGGSTLTDTSAAGTVATGATNVLGGNTIAATNARTITDYYTTYINAATAGTNVTLTNKWALGLAGAAQIAAGTFTAAQPALDMSQTWNNAGVRFTGIKLNVTSTASAAASLLMDLQVGGASRMNVDKYGTLRSGTDYFPVLYGQLGDYGLAPGSNFKVVHNSFPFLFFDPNNGLYTSSHGVGFASASAQPGFGGSYIQTQLYGGGNGVLEQRPATANGGDAANSPQEYRVYAKYTGASNYQRCSIKTGKTTLSNVTGASVTATGLIPAGALLIGVTSRVNTTCTNATGYTVGTASDPDLWGVASAVAAGTATGSANFTAAGASGLFTAATDVVITPTGGNFDGTGVIELAVHYLLTEAD